MREPDVFFDLSFSKPAQNRLRARGYVKLYEQKGIVVSDSLLLPGWKQPASGQIWIG